MSNTAGVLHERRTKTIRLERMVVLDNRPDFVRVGQTFGFWQQTRWSVQPTKSKLCLISNVLSMVELFPPLLFLLLFLFSPNATRSLADSVFL